MSAPPPASPPLGNVAGLTLLVTGGAGFVGHRLTELLLARGAARVVSLDILPRPRPLAVPGGAAGAPDASSAPHHIADLARLESLEPHFVGVDAVFHIGALVGPFHPRERYFEVNLKGTENVLKAAEMHGVKRIVMSSSPSTRFDGSDFVNKKESEVTYPKVFLETYAESKAQGEQKLLAACGTKDADLLTIAVAPHQVYGPHDMLFLPNLLNAARSGKLKIFGDGENDVAFTHVDNYCHGLILGHAALYEGSPALGKFYWVTDGGSRKFWAVLDEAIVAMGFTSLYTKIKLPYALLMFVAYVCVVLGKILNRKFKLNPFTVKMLTIHRWFDISAAQKDLGYAPVVRWEEGWAETIKWFKENEELWVTAAKNTGKVSEGQTIKKMN